MVGFDLLLIPDTGRQFVRCLKTAALYAEKIYCVSSAAPQLIKRLPSGTSSKFGERTNQFLDAAALHEKDFALLRAQGILGSMDDPPDPAAPTEEQREELMLDIFRSCLIRYGAAKHLVRAGRVKASFLEEMGRNKARRMSPPSAWHALQDVAFQALAQSTDADMKKHLTAQVIERFIYEIYTKLLIDAADFNDITILTYSDVFEQSISEIRRYPSPSSTVKPEEYLRVQVEEYRRRTAGNKLAHRVLSSRLPRVDDLTLEDVLDLRLKHKDQIDAFRVGLAEMAAQIDVTKSPEQDNAQIEQLIRSKVDPAVADLKAGIRNSKIDIWKSLYGPKETAAAATVSVGLSYVTHGTTPGNVMAGLVTILFPALSALASGRLERRRLMGSSRWSLLIDVENET